ncbi:MAG TPA: ATP-binding protein [Nanoarchaeota archaeon]|nr:ATP-binding protein [Nanoarchaeota archaeon]
MFDENFVIEYFEKLFERLKKEDIKQRELKISFIKNKVTAIIGPRRAGKTYFILKFLKENKNSIYFDLEHAAFKDLTHKEFFEIISIFEERFKIKVKNVLLDEIQRIDKWEILVRSLLDSGYKVLITGSSSKLLSKEIATQLRGRSLSYLLLPLSFREYLNFRNFNLRKPFSLSEKVKIINFLKEYLEWGSYPEILLEWDKKEKILKEYFDTVLQKDFIERFKVVNVEIAKLIFEFVFQNFSKELSINKIANFVSSKLSKNVKNIVYEYVEKLPESFAVFFVERFEESVYKRKSFMRKVYICDVGLANIIGVKKDFGKRMENIVFLELLRKTNEKPLITVYYWKDYQGKEVDFVIKEGLRIKQLIQVTYASARDEIEQRELRALVKASELLKCKDLLVITWDYECEEEFKGKKIKFIPLWKWLLISN